MSGIIRYISDLHFGHKNMAIKRGFPDAYHHDQNIIAQWNAIVRKGDTTWILGDVTMEKADYGILDELKGYKRVILGNHDKGQHVKVLQQYVNTIHGMVKLRGKEYGNIWLTHCPVHPCELEYRVTKNIHGHCVDLDTEILTFEGWKKYNEIKEKDIIYSYNSINNKLEKDEIKSIIYIDNYKGKMYSLKGKGIDMMVSDKHKVVSLSDSNEYLSEDADYAFSKNILKIIKSSFYYNNGIKLSDNLLRLYIWLAADGNIKPETNLGRFNLKKTRKITILKKLLLDLKINFSENSSKDFTRLNFTLPKELEEYNIKGLDVKILNCNRKQVEIIKHTYSITDGNRNLIFTSKLCEVNLLQHLFVINGFQCKVHPRKNHGFSKSISYQLSVTDKQTQLMPNIKNRVKEINNYNKPVWCITSNNKNWIARRSGSVFITGNCHENSLDDERYINVSAEVIDYKPKTLNELLG